jgi:hypothetical protein
VAILLGGDVPYLLRDHEDHQTLVREAYVEGIMSGELLKLFAEETVFADSRPKFKGF